MFATYASTRHDGDKNIALHRFFGGSRMTHRMDFGFNRGHRTLQLWTRVWILAILSLCWAVSSPARLQAQALTGMTGNVTDPTGAVIAGANVTITSEATGVVSHAVTTDAGTYAVIGRNTQSR